MTTATISPPKTQHLILSLSPPKTQHLILSLAIIAAVLLFVAALDVSGKKAILFVVGLGLGISLYHAAFGFTGAYKRALTEGDITGVTAQLLMIAAAMVLFAPILAQGKVGGSVAPVSVSMALGAFVFGIGMQLGSGCASGTLFAAGGGSIRMILVLLFFCIGAFWGSLDLYWWLEWPSIGSVSLGDTLGWNVVIPAQIAALGLVYLGLRRMGGENKRSMWWGEGGFTWERLLRGPWPLLLSAGILALLNWVTLMVAGHAWSITWAFSLWAAKGAVLLGWDPATSEFWADRAGFLTRSVFADNTSVMNFGLMIGALAAASLAGKVKPTMRIPPKALLTAVIGGLMMGYGARLAFGCNIGSFFSGIASTSLHGWIWILCAIPGNVIGVRINAFMSSRS